MLYSLEFVKSLRDQDRFAAQLSVASLMRFGSQSRESHPTCVLDKHLVSAEAWNNGTISRKIWQICLLRGVATYDTLSRYDSSTFYSSEETDYLPPIFRKSYPGIHQPSCIMFHLP